MQTVRTLLAAAAIGCTSVPQAPPTSAVSEDASAPPLPTVAAALRDSETPPIEDAGAQHHHHGGDHGGH